MLEYFDDDGATNLIERRWFAACAAVEAMESECGTLREVMELAQDAYRRARIELAELTELRDSLAAPARLSLSAA
jgi:hypothetical protein